MSKRGSGSSARAGGGFTQGQKQAINQMGERAKNVWDIIGDVTFKKGEGDIVYMSFKQRQHFDRDEGIIERISDVTKTLVVSPDGKYRKIIGTDAKHTETIIPKRRAPGNRNKR